MSEGAVDEVTIADITRAADVGHGSFYLHFKSKHEVLVPIIQARAAKWDEKARQLLAGSDDAAEVVAFSTRYMARAALKDTLWRWFLRSSTVPQDDMAAAVGRFGERDFKNGIQAGRFVVPGEGVYRPFVLGAFVSTLLSCLELDERSAHAAIDDMAELILRVLGIGIEEANKLARLPLE